MGYTLNFVHKALSIKGVPDNLRIAVAEEFSLEVVEDLSDGWHYEWAATEDPILKMDAPKGAKLAKFKAEALGESNVFLMAAHATEPRKIERTYVVNVVAAEAVSAVLRDRGTEPAGSEQA